MQCVSLKRLGLVWRKGNVFPFDRSAAIEEKFAQFSGVILSIFPRIKAEKDATAGIEMSLEVVQKKSPFRWPPPPVALAFAVEVDRKRGDQIELSTEIWQRLEGANRPDPSLDSKEIEQLREERIYVDIQAQTRVPQLLEDEEEEPAPATEVEDRLWRAAVQFQILRAHNVQTQPSLYISVFGVVLGR